MKISSVAFRDIQTNSLYIYKQQFAQEVRGGFENLKNSLLLKISHGDKLNQVHKNSG